MTDEEMQEVLAMDFLRVPNVFFKIRPQLKPSEFACLLFIWQKTGGWNKTHDHISISQFTSEIDGVGLTRRTIQTSLKSLTEMDLIDMDVGYNNLYRFSIHIRAVIKLSEQTQGVQKTTQGVQFLTQGVQKTTSSSANSAPTIDIKQKNTTKDKTIDKEAEKAEKKKSVIFKPEKPELLKQAIWDDLLTHRKNKKTSETETAWNSIFNAIDRAQKTTGHSLDTIFSYWLVRDWKGFNDKWYVNAHPTQSAQVKSYEQPKQSKYDNHKQSLQQSIQQQFAAEETEQGINSSNCRNVYEVDS